MTLRASANQFIELVKSDEAIAAYRVIGQLAKSLVVLVFTFLKFLIAHAVYAWTTYKPIRSLQNWWNEEFRHTSKTDYPEGVSIDPISSTDVRRDNQQENPNGSDSILPTRPITFIDLVIDDQNQK